MKTLILVNGMKDIQAEAIHTFIKPETHHIEHGFFDGRVAPVQIRLEGQKAGVIPLPGVRIVVPARPSRDRFPVIGRAISLPIPPDIPISFGIIPTVARFLKPGVFDRGVIQHQIEEHAHPAGVDFLDQLFSLSQCTVFGGDTHIIADIVAKILLRAAKEG